MDRHYQGQHYHGNQQHQGSNNSPYPWSGNNSMPQYRGQTPPSSSPSIPPQNRIPNGGNMYYNQAQVNHNNTSSYGGASNQPYSSNQQAYPQHSANRAPQYGQPVNPWGQYNQGQPYNTVAQPPPPPPNTVVPVQAPGQSYNQYMYPPPTTPNQNNQNQGQNNMPYSQPVHSYYQMQQPSNYYYSPNQMYPAAVPPPPLPQDPPPPPPKETYKTDTAPSASANDNGREILPFSKRSEDRPSKSSPPHAEKTAKSSKDKKSAQHTVDEKDKEEKETKKAVPIMVGKRRGGRVLPTGVVKKQKVEDDNSKGKSDAWSQYMAEVRRYKDQSCTEERQNRPLVK